MCHRGIGAVQRRVPQFWKGSPVLAIVLMMLIVVVVSAAVVVYVAYPHRGHDTPVLPQVGQAMRKGVDALPTIEDEHSRV